MTNHRHFIRCIRWSVFSCTFIAFAVYYQKRWITTQYHFIKSSSSKTSLHHTSDQYYYIQLTNGKEFECDVSLHVVNPYTHEIVISRYGTNYSDRSQRFPSPEERLKVYLSNWYTPPCHRDDPSAVRYTSAYQRNDYSTNQQINNGTTSNTTEQSLTIDIMYLGDNLSSNENITWDVDNDVKSDVIFYLDGQKIIQAASNKMGGLVQSYSHDVLDSIIPTMKQIDYSNYVTASTDIRTTFRDASDAAPPILLQYGDSVHCKNHRDREVFNIPIIKKFRLSIDPKDMNRIAMNDETSSSICTSRKRIIPNPTSSQQEEQLQNSLQPILWKLNTQRHYASIYDTDKLDGIPYEKKKNVAVFRGAMTGHHHWNGTWTQEQHCRATPRCNLVLLYHNSSIIDARITGKSGRRSRPPFIDILPSEGGENEPYDADNSTTSKTQYTRVDLKGELLSLEELLQYKAIIIIEGNDVSSGLKWALYSSSVVIMPYPTTETSWAMEELLEPWVHFVPVKPDLSDLEYVMNWILTHEEEAQYISLRATLWIEDLVLSEEALMEETRLQDEILKRYHSLFYL